VKAFAQASYQMRQRWRHSRAFVTRNARELRQPRLLGRKMRTLVQVHLKRIAFFLVALPFAITVAIVIRLVARVIVVRFGSINASRVGHLAMDTEMLESEKELGIGLPRSPVFDVYFPWTGPFPVANRLLLNMWRRSVRVWPAFLCEPVDSVSRLMPFGDRFVIPARKGIEGVPNLVQGDPYGVLPRTRPHIGLTPNEEYEALCQLREMSMDPSNPHVCLLVRDDAHFAALGRELEAHNYRNARIDTYLDSVIELVHRGYNVFRMGVSASSPLGFSHQGFHDFPFSGARTELLDVYLTMTCRFFVSTGTGLDSLAVVARRPVLLTNYSQVGELRLSMSTLVLPRRAWSVSEGRYLTLSEQFAIGLHKMTEAEQFASVGVSFDANSPSEILDAVIEMEERSTGEWKPRSDEESLQGQFLDQVPEYLKLGGVRGRVVYSFLREHPEWRA
jgi:putative glycosyltransferase (TIGR04372 family)